MFARKIQRTTSQSVIGMHVNWYKETVFDVLIFVSIKAYVFNLGSPG